MTKPVDDLLHACLEAPATLRESVLERLCREHPDHAAELRCRYTELRGAGLLECLDDGRRPAFGEFLLLERLGAGGMGEVWLAEQPRLGRTVALKLVRPELLPSRPARERFRREASMLGKLDHHGLAAVLEAGEWEGRPYLAMRWVEGPSLEAWIDRSAHPRPEWRGSVTLIEQAARALHEAHEAGLVHRDVKPANVVIGSDGRPVVIDFGLAHAEDERETRLTWAGDLAGTPAYMSPEQAKASRSTAAATSTSSAWCCSSC